MNRILLAASMLAFTIAGVSKAESAASSAANSVHYTQAQLKQMIRDANSPQQYKALADYFSSRQSDYLKQAAEEKQEWIRRSQNVMVVAAKYPRPVDSARYLYEYYLYEASEAGSLADKYQRLTSAQPSQSK